MLRADRLTKFFYPRIGLFGKKKIRAVCNVSLDIKEGEIFGLLGPNGSGKTTLIRILSGLIIPDQGEAHLDGRSIIRGDEIKNRIGLVLSSERSFYFRLSGYDNLRFFAGLQNMFGREADKRIIAVLKLVGLTEFAHVQFQNYSEGMKQKLSIGRALLHNPDILFLDEPSAGLDPLAAKAIRDFIKNILSHNKQKTIVLVTQDLTEAITLCDRIAILYKGRIRYQNQVRKIGSSRKLFKKFQAIVGKK